MESDMIVGYARVSTDGQTLDAQQSALAAAGAERVFAEKVSRWPLRARVISPKRVGGWSVTDIRQL